MLQSSVGQAWLAFSRREERETLLALLAAPDRAEDAVADRANALARQLSLVRRRGYALRPDGASPWPHTGSIALPVRHRGAVLGCVNAVWMARAVSTEEGVRLCLEPLRGVVREIEEAISRTSHAATAR